MAQPATATDAPLRLYYAEQPRDRWLPGDRHLRALVRPLIHGGTVASGFRKVVANLRLGLRRLGIPHRLNDVRFLRDSPGAKIGLIGNRWNLRRRAWTQPIVAGPALLDHPLQWPRLLDELDVRAFLVPSEWNRKVFEPYFGPRVRVWPVGIDTEAWPDAAGRRKDTDFLVYAKFKSDAERKRRLVLEPLLERLGRRGLTSMVVSYGSYTEQRYRQCLARCRGMLFLSEWETQGIAYQEALSSNVPVLAWERGRMDCPPWPSVPASSVPYFSGECGVKFRRLEEFDERLDEFLSRRFRPRSYVLENLSVEDCALRYLRIFEES
jgi:glycosyltransferase involved in cell wall biosynthesis